MEAITKGMTRKEIKINIKGDHKKWYEGNYKKCDMKGITKKLI